MMSIINVQFHWEKAVVEKHLYNVGFTRIVKIFKHSLLFVGPHFNEVLPVVHLYVPASHYLPQNVSVLLDPKQHR